MNKLLKISILTFSFLSFSAKSFAGVNLEYICTSEDKNTIYEIYISSIHENVFKNSPHDFRAPSIIEITTNEKNSAINATVAAGGGMISVIDENKALSILISAERSRILSLAPAGPEAKLNCVKANQL